MYEIRLCKIGEIDLLTTFLKNFGLKTIFS